MNVLTWQATYNQGLKWTRIDLCKHHSGNAAQCPDPLPLPTSVQKSWHEGNCEWCELESNAVLHAVAGMKR